MQVSSNKQRVLVLSDVHQDIARLRYILTHEDYDFIVNLGDLFDSFDYRREDDIVDTCKFITEYIDNPNYISLQGNHDLHYLYSSPMTWCSGYHKNKEKVINRYFKQDKIEVRKKFRWYCWIDDFLCTHAGLHPYYLSPMQSLNKEELSIWLDNESKKAETNLLIEQPHWFYSAGKARGGRASVGGIVWLDFNQEFVAIDGLNQLCGHTPYNNITQYKNTNSYDIDCHVAQYLIIQNGKLEIKDYVDL
jgi:hypothetical protein